MKIIFKKIGRSLGTNRLSQWCKKDIDYIFDWLLAGMTREEQPNIVDLWLTLPHPPEVKLRFASRRATGDDERPMAARRPFAEKRQTPATYVEFLPHLKNAPGASPLPFTRFNYPLLFSSLIWRAHTAHFLEDGQTPHGKTGGETDPIRRQVATASFPEKTVCGHVQWSFPQWFWGHCKVLESFLSLFHIKDTDEDAYWTFSSWR